ncbi:MAG: hypothetical protein JNM27_13810 [Leptospirales bacterium]|nr:hypothetical protein [Leptospirales bacterium]
MRETNGLLSTDLQVLGITDPFALEIRIAADDIVFGNLVIWTEDSQVSATILHEWTHYFHCIGTSVGIYLFEHRWRHFLARWNLLHAVSRIAGPLPGLKLPLAALIANLRRTVEPIAELCANLEVLLQSERRMLNSWKEKVTVGSGADIIRDRRIVLEANTASVLISSPIQTIPLKVSARQVLEHAARSNEYRLNGGVIHRETFFHRQLLDYNLLYYFLIQQGIISLEELDDGFIQLTSVDNSLPFDTLMSIVFFCATIALQHFVNPMLDRNRYNPTPRLSEGLTSLDPGMTEYHNDSMAYVFLKLLQNIALIIPLQEKGNSLRLSDIEQMLERMQIHGFAGLLNRQIALTDLLVRMKSDLSVNMFDLRIARAFQAIRRQPSLYFDAMNLAHLITAPKYNLRSENGPKFASLQFPWQELDSPKIDSRDLSMFYANADRIMDRLLGGRDFACYHSDASKSEATDGMGVYGCTDFSTCYAANKSGKNLQEFCSKIAWQGYTVQTLELISQSDIRIFYNPITTDLVDRSADLEQASKDFRHFYEDE